MTERKVEKTEEQWRQELTEFEYHVLREAGTERAYTGELLNEERKGTFRCRGCSAEQRHAGRHGVSVRLWPAGAGSAAAAAATPTTQKQQPPRKQ